MKKTVPKRRTGDGISKRWSMVLVLAGIIAVCFIIAYALSLDLESFVETVLVSVIVTAFTLMLFAYLLKTRGP